MKVKVDKLSGARCNLNSSDFVPLQGDGMWSLLPPGSAEHRNQLPNASLIRRCFTKMMFDMKKRHSKALSK